MSSLSKSLALIFFAALLAFSLILLQSVSAQSTATPSVSEFSLQYADHSYNVPPEPTSTKDPYTGEVTSSTIPGYRVENKTIDATIKNPPGATYYNFRWKGSFEDNWHYNPFNPDGGDLAYFIPDGYSVPFQASDLDYSVFSLTFLPQHITPNGSIDVQVQALYGNFDAVPYVHVMPVGGPTYDFYFEGQAGDWSSTQTVTYGQPSPSPTQGTDQPTGPDAAASTTPSAPEFPVIVILPLLALAPLVIALLKRRSGLVKNP